MSSFYCSLCIDKAKSRTRNFQSKMTMVDKSYFAFRKGDTPLPPFPQPSHQLRLLTQAEQLLYLCSPLMHMLFLLAKDSSCVNSKQLVLFQQVSEAPRIVCSLQTIHGRVNTRRPSINAGSCLFLLHCASHPSIPPLKDTHISVAS